MKRSLAALLLTTLSLAASADSPPAIEHVEPPFWWTGMAHKGVQLMVHGAGIGLLQPTIDHPGVRLVSSTRVANPNYLFIDLEVGLDAQPGSFDIVLTGQGRSERHPYLLRARETGSKQRQGFGNGDAIYQIMPDRFANGDPGNDNVPGLLERADRRAGGGRHGGDIQGAIDRLDYIAGLGFTQLWPTPLVENDMPAYSYHGYAATNHYRIDPRYGSNEDFVRLSREAKKRGIGLIQDVVLSHIGKGHWWMKDLPTPDWVNFGGRFVPTAHHRVAVQDKYAAQADSRNFTAGWFAPGMPDLNQTNPLVATYLIQNNIWWIEYAGLSGLRIDTYSYSDGAFLTEYTKRLMREYPELNLVGEEWSTRVPVVARWQRGKANFDGYTSSLASLMDFPLVDAMRSALAKPGENGLNEVYETLSLDYLYPEPDKLVLFGGNHDMARMVSAVGGDFARWRMNLVFLMTMPRIPQFYSGDEILMTSTTEGRDDASYRLDFPGGWRGDKVDAFTGTGLDAQQRAAQDLVRKLANWRKSEPVIHSGRLMQFGPEHNTWVYFRYNKDKRIMVAMNNNDKEMRLPAARFQEMLKGTASGVDVLTGKTVSLADELRLAPKSVLLVELPGA
ncbi:glycoside hydrolase family 13 protein [Massilia sp. Dwa41.01b]|uniref:glycoside hydrolase family 13 protein n=1 Tax=unclassified Massilia TaxID=2609279 RepID=UPI0016030791|nr:MULTISPECIES: glycoside hydrolase family 13 protein [unclassified Massilia]QNA90248.1 glycoside hydrolase family 13 protein [Massilia sp. Dwa41.01b]QNB01141.1 glycoside hydrolase family 13 protein [Massilia sp. Se16.2.3]